MPGFRVFTSDKTRDRFTRGMSWLGFSLALLLVLLPLISFAQAHLWKFQSFRAFDTGHSGGDHICDLRRDSDGLGRPDRLGDYVTISGSVIAEPSTYETGGWLFWVRQAGCGILVYGEQEALCLGDSVCLRGWLRLTNGNYFFTETGLATLGDLAIENGGVRVMGAGYPPAPVTVTARELGLSVGAYGGNLVRVPGFRRAGRRADRQGDSFVWLHGARDSVLVYLDHDTGCSLEAEPQAEITVTGVLVRMDTPACITSPPAWCLAPRTPDDIAIQQSGAAVAALSWSDVKKDFFDQD